MIHQLMQDYQAPISQHQVAAGFQSHARTCKKSLDQCATCKRGIEFFRGVEARSLSRILEEYQHQGYGY